MRKTFHYRLYPTKKQIQVLNEHLEECRWLWNTLLDERKTAWEERQEAISYFDQQNALPGIKATVRPGLKAVHSLVVQDVAQRLKKAMEAFFRRVNAGEKPGYPRFKGRGRYDSLTYPQWGNGVTLSANGKHLLLSKVSDLKVILHRPLEGTPKTATIRRTATGKWFVSISCEWEPTALPPTDQEIGIDVGLKVFAKFSDGREIANPRFFRSEEHALAKAQRQHQVALDAHKAKRTEVTQRIKAATPEAPEPDIWHQVRQDRGEQATWNERQKRRKVVARIHERITWRRDDFAHQHSRKIVNQYDLIAVEDLTIIRMIQDGKLSKSIHDVAWGQFLGCIACKAEWAGRQYIAVNPAYTSQECSRCGWRNPTLTLADRIFQCLNPDCLLVIDRDHNGALNVLARGRACLGLVPEKPPDFSVGSRH